MRRAIAKLNEYSAPLIEALTREARVHIEDFSQQVCGDTGEDFVTMRCSLLFSLLAGRLDCAIALCPANPAVL